MAADLTRGTDVEARRGRVAARCASIPGGGVVAAGSDSLLGLARGEARGWALGQGEAEKGSGPARPRALVGPGHVLRVRELGWFGCWASRGRGRGKAGPALRVGPGQGQVGPARREKNGEKERDSAQENRKGGFPLHKMIGREGKKRDRDELPRIYDNGILRREFRQELGRIKGV